MADKLLLDLLTEKISLDSFKEWISGREDKKFCFSINRTEFALYILNYIQEETSKFIDPPANNSNHINRAKDKVHLQENHSKSPTHVKNINSTPETKKQNLSRYFNSSSNQVCQNISTSTPVQQRRNNNHHENSLISPSSHGSPKKHTPNSSRGLGHNITSSSGSPMSSPQSCTSTLSPTSPLYLEAFPDLSSKNRQRTRQSPCLADFIVSKTSSQKSRKRIKPTKLANVSDTDHDYNNEKFGSVNRPYVPITAPFQCQSETKDKPNFEDERNILKQKRAELLASNISEHTVKNISPQNLKFEDSKIEKSLDSSGSPVQILSSRPLQIIDPDPSLVTSVEYVTKLAVLYSACLDNNLVPNITSEIHLIFTLLTTSFKLKVDTNINSEKEDLTNNLHVKGSATRNKQSHLALQDLNLCDKKTKMGDNVNYNSTSSKLKPGMLSTILNSIHDCVMFASVVIEKQYHLIQWLDKSVLKLLLKNPRLLLFIPHFIPSLAAFAESKDINQIFGEPMNVTLEDRPVVYHSELDNKDNFTSLSSFNIFKKQRDGFYETLYEWRSKNTDSLWSSKRFPLKVQNLLGLSKDPINMMHLARLFCGQLVSSEDKYIKSKIDLPSVNKDKLSRLEARFSKPQDIKISHRPTIQFPGEQQFYQQFIMIAATSCSVFLTHVLDCILHNLNLLDNNKFFEDSMNIEETKAKVESCISKSCLLAKFLGLIIFSPYRTSVHCYPHPDILNAQIEARQQVLPPVNVLAYVQRAVESNRLIVTVPWIVTFLGMMDPVAPHLLPFHLALQLLVSIYSALPLPHLSPLSSVLLRTTLGWLFDISFFPEALFFSLISNCSPIKSHLEPPDVDVRNVVDQPLIKIVCPFLGSLRLLLSTSDDLKRGAARHITPIPAQATSITQAIAVQTLELQMEESFLVGQAASFRSTVDFVIDRISSSCINHVCSNILPPAKEPAHSTINIQTNFNKDTGKRSGKSEKQDLVTQMCKATEAEIMVVIADHCGQKIEKALIVLLGPDANDPKIFQMACNICRRRCKERIIKWLNSHIKLSELFSKVTPTVDSKPTNESVKVAHKRKSYINHDIDFSPPDLLIHLQDKLCQLIESRDSSVLTEQQVMDILQSTLQTINHSNDLMLTAEQHIYTLTVDFSIVLLALSPEVMTPSVVAQLCVLWSSCSPMPGGPIERLMSPRNVLLLCQGGADKAQLSWKHFTGLLLELLNKGILTPLQLESQCVALFRQDWPPMVFSLIRGCLSAVVDKIKQDPLCKMKPKIMLMLEWLNEITNDFAKDEL